MLRSAYGPKDRVFCEVIGKSLTKQSFAAECNINNIMKKYQKSGAVTHFNRHSPEYGFATGASFTDAMLLVVAAQDMFADLPSSIRTRFGNDPTNFLDFVQNPDNAEEMVELGLAEARRVASPVQVEIVAQAEPEADVEPEADTVVA